MSTMNARVQDMTGQRFGNLFAVRVTGRAASGDLKWEFVCDCGLVFTANGYYARCGKITTCPECAAERSKRASITHGMSNSREFGIWVGMHTRCYNPKAASFHNYGGRGIEICQRWRDSFENFLHDMGFAPSPRHSIERKDNDGHYTPDNCYWATAIEQANNKRTNIVMTINGVTRTLSQWAKFFGATRASAFYRYSQGLRGEAVFKTTKTVLTHNGISDTVSGWSKRTGIKATTINQRLKYHWSVERALSQGVHK